MHGSARVANTLELTMAHCNRQAARHLRERAGALILRAKDVAIHGDKTRPRDTTMPLLMHGSL